MVITIVLIAKTKDDVGKAAIDVFSFSHLIFGYLLYPILHSIIYISVRVYSNFVCLLGTVLMSLFWEAIENSLLYRKGIKFGNRRDSLKNSLMDIYFFSSGGVISMYNLTHGLIYFLISTFLFLNSLLFLIMVYAFKILGFSSPLSKMKKN